MQKITSHLYIAAALFLFSCSNEDKRSTGASSVQSSSSSDAAAVPVNTVPAANSQPQQPAGIPPANQPAQTTTALPPLNNNLTTTKLNPPHGQPGHDCSVEVGKPLPTAGTLKPNPAPLNNPAQTTPAVNVTPQPAATATPPILTPNLPSAKTGLNPAHGQPGHRCDIAVGAPLNSPPVKTTTPTAVTTNTQQNGLPQKISVPTVSANPPAPLPAAPTVAPTTAPAAAGLNPEHGKPGHRCDIAVGAPLPKQ